MCSGRGLGFNSELRSGKRSKGLSCPSFEHGGSGMKRWVNRRTLLTLLFGVAVLCASALHALNAEEDFIIVQSTTSTQDSGLFEHILPMFTKKTGIEVRVMAVGTGQALTNAQNGDGDVVLVHSKPDGEKFVTEGWGVKRQDVMYNDFIIVGPSSDPAKTGG